MFIDTHAHLFDEKIQIDKINFDNLDAVKDYVDQVIEDVKAFVKDTFKPLAINKVNSFYS